MSRSEMPQAPNTSRPVSAPPAVGGEFRANLPAATVHEALRGAIDEHDRSEQNVVLWFGEMVRRKLYLRLGYATIHHYAGEALGFSRNRTYRFLRLVESLERLPRLKHELGAGRIGWTVAREIAKVAGPGNEERWIALAMRQGRREIERTARKAKLERRARLNRNPRQVTLSPGCEGSAAAGAQGSPSGSAGGSSAATVGTGRVSPAENLVPSSIASSTSPSSQCPGAHEGGLGAPLRVGPVDEDLDTDRVVDRNESDRSSRAAPPPAEDSPATGDAPPAEDSPATGDAPPAEDSRPTGDAPPADGSRITVAFRLEPLEYARFEAMREAILKSRYASPNAARTELLLLAFEHLLDACKRSSQGDGPAHAGSGRETTGAGDSPDPCRSANQDGPSSEPAAVASRRDGHESSTASGVLSGSRNCERCSAPAGGRSEIAPMAELPRGNSASPYHIIIYKCAACQAMGVRTHRGLEPLSTADAVSISCDAIVQQSGRRNRATIPSSVRLDVLHRDRHRCQAPGCRHTRFLEIHHLVSRAAGGSNRPANLITLCSQCHRMAHLHGVDWLVRRPRRGRSRR